MLRRTMQEALESGSISATTSRPTIAFRRVGQPDGTPVVLVHGVGSASLTWQETVRRVPADWSVVTPDLRGHGNSESPTGPYTLDELSVDLGRVLDAAGMGSAHVVGFSVGALVAARFALKDPDRVRSLALLSSIADRTPEEQAKARARLASIATSPPAASAPSSAERWFTEGFRRRRADLVDEEISIVSATDPDGYAGVYRVLAESEIVGEVGGIGVPTLILTGELDLGSTPRMSRELHARIAGSELHVLAGVKHYVHIEAADELTSLLIPFIQHHGSNRTDRSAPPTNETGVIS